MPENLPISTPLAGVSNWIDAVGHFFQSITDVALIPLILGLFCFLLYLSCRSRAFMHVLQAAYPDAQVKWLHIWGAYVAAYGFNNVVPARGGDVIKLFLVKTSIPRATYPALASSLFVETVVDGMLAIPILIFALTQGIFPKPPSFADLGAFDLSFVASNPKLTLFVLTAAVVGLFVLTAFFSQRAIRFWHEVRQGVAMLRDRRRFFREVVAIMLVGYFFRLAAFWFLLDAFHVGGSVRSVFLVHAINAIAALMPFTPGGAGVQQAFMTTVFKGSATASVVAAYSVGQQIAIAVASLGVGFFAIYKIFGFRSFKDVIAAGRESRALEKEMRATRKGARLGTGPSRVPGALHARASRLRETRSPLRYEPVLPDLQHCPEG